MSATNDLGMHCHTDSCMCQIDGIELVDLVVAVYIVWLNNCEAVVENFIGLSLFLRLDLTVEILNL